MGLFDQLGGREWVRAVGARLDGPTTDREVRLLLPDGSGPNRAAIAVKPAGVEVSFGRVTADDGEDMGTFPVRTPAEAARLVEDLVAASAARARAKATRAEPAAA